MHSDEAAEKSKRLAKYRLRLIAAIATQELDATTILAIADLLGGLPPEVPHVE